MVLIKHKESKARKANTVQMPSERLSVHGLQQLLGLTLYFQCQSNSFAISIQIQAQTRKCLYGQEECSGVPNLILRYLEGRGWKPFLQMYKNVPSTIKKFARETRSIFCSRMLINYIINSVLLVNLLKASYTVDTPHCLLLVEFTSSEDATSGSTRSISHCLSVY